MPEISSPPLYSGNKLRVFVADDHAVVREGLKALINTQSAMVVVGEAGDGLITCQEVERLRPDVVIMDIALPGLNGARATERIKTTCPHVKVLALSVHEEKGYLLDVLSARASGYVLKRTAAVELIHAIRTVATGGTYLDPAIAHKVLSNVHHKLANGEIGQGIELSHREAEALRLIALGYSIKEIAAQMEISGKTVETYRSRFMEKLGLDSRTDIVRYALQQGWLEDS